MQAPVLSVARLCMMKVAITFTGIFVCWDVRTHTILPTIPIPISRTVRYMALWILSAVVVTHGLRSVPYL